MSTVLPDDTQALKRMLVRSQAELLEARLTPHQAAIVNAVQTARLRPKLIALNCNGSS